MTRRMLERTCPVCGAVFPQTYRHKMPYCSMDCHFWLRVDQSGGPEACWPWTGSRKSEKGYGQFSHGVTMQSLRSHQVAYKLHHKVSEIPDGLFVCHTCDNPSCCNPSHLWLGTVQQNNADRDRKGRTRTGWVPGSRNGLAKLNESLIPIIRSRYNDGESPSALGVEYGVTASAIVAVGKRQTWKHV